MDYVLTSAMFHKLMKNLEMTSDSCAASFFKCPNEKCIDTEYICDGIDTCGDNFDEINCTPFQCHPLAFQCLNGKCISAGYFCNAGDQCGDNSDEQYCSKTTDEACPASWFECPNKKRCIISQWVCNGFDECPEESEEKHCAANAAKQEMRSWLLKKRKTATRRDQWGPQVHRIAVALHLDDNTTFSTGNITGEAIRNALTIQLLYRLPRNQTSSHELALYIHALLVACMDPSDFYGRDLVRELRRRVDLSGNYTNPFLILVLCNAGDTMTSKDVDRVSAAYDSQHRPFWTDYQALASMALSCIASRSRAFVDERILMEMLQELKKRQFRNGTIDNFRTTALVTQALFIHNSYEEDFNLDSAITVLIDGIKESKSILNVYYTLPVLHRKSLLNISSNHCIKQQVEEADALQKTLEAGGEKINVHYSVWIGDEINFGRTWRLRMLANSTIYDVIEAVAKIDNRQKLGYNVVNGKPYIASLNEKEDDPEIGMFWFIYLKSLNSDENPRIIEQSPVDIHLVSNQEIILWYKRGLWDSSKFTQTPVVST